MKPEAILIFFKKHLTRRRLIILAIIMVAAFLAFAFSQRSKQKPLEYTQVKRGDILETVSASGVLAGKQTVNLKFRAAGKLAFLNVKPGDQLFAGQTIASLDTTELSIALQQAKNNLRDRQASVDKVIDDIHLFQYGNGGLGNVGSANETMTQKAARTTAEVARDNAFDSVKAAEQVLADATIFSPISGTIIKADFVAGQVVSPSDTIIQIADSSQLYFDAEADEADTSKISLGQKAKVSLDAYPNQTFEGVVKETLPATKTTSAGAVVIVVRVALENTNIRFISGLNGQVTIIQSQKKAVLTIPQQALREDNTVLVQTTSGFKSQKVTTGARSDTDVEIEGGLQDGDKVVLNPAAAPPRSGTGFSGILRLFGAGPRR